MTTIQGYTKAGMDAIIATLATQSALTSGLAGKADASTVTSLSTNVDRMGYIASGVMTSDGTAITSSTETDTGLTTGSFNVISGRRYKIEVFANILGSVANNIAALRLTNSSNTVLAQSAVTCTNTTYGIGTSMFYTFVAGSSASVIYKLRGALVVGSGNIKVTAGPTYPATILVTDIT